MQQPFGASEATLAAHSSSSSLDVQDSQHHPVYFSTTTSSSAAAADVAALDEKKRPCGRGRCQKLVQIVKSRMAFRPPVPSDPRLFPKSQKRWILACLALGSSLNGFCSTIYLPGIPDITDDLQASTIAVTLTTSLFILFGGIGPIFWASLSDYYHIRRFLYLNSLLIFSAASAGCALVSNVYFLIVLRCIQSVGTSVTTSVGAGTVSDCWEITERGAAFSILFVGQFFGPLIGPILGGGLTTALGWRSTFWFCTGYGLFLFFFLFVFLPETYRLDHVWRLPNNNKVVVSGPSTSAITMTTTNGSGAIATYNTSTMGTSEAVVVSPPRKIINPLQSIFLLRHLFVFLIAVETGTTFGTMFTIETIIPNLYETTYAFESWQIGLSFMGAGLGNILGSIVSGRVSDYLLKKARKRRGGAAKREDRLTLNAWPGGFFLVPTGVLLFGWSITAQWVVWISILGFGIVCFGMSQVYAAGSAYLVDAIPGRGASVTAASNVIRMTMASVLSLVAQPVVDSIGPGYLSVILAGLNIFGMLLFLLVKWKGQILRERAGYSDNHE